MFRISDIINWLNQEYETERRANFYYLIIVIICTSISLAIASFVVGDDWSKFRQIITGVSGVGITLSTAISFLYAILKNNNITDTKNSFITTYDNHLKEKDSQANNNDVNKDESKAGIAPPEHNQRDTDIKPSKVDEIIFEFLLERINRKYENPFPKNDEHNN